jgi:hypothetical protein
MRRMASKSLDYSVLLAVFGFRLGLSLQRPGDCHWVWDNYLLQERELGSRHGDMKGEIKSMRYV